MEFQKHAPGFSALTFQAIHHGFISSATSTGKSSLASEQSINEDSMTTAFQHHGKVDLGDKPTTRRSSLKQSMLPLVAQGKEKPLLLMILSETSCKEETTALVHGFMLTTE